MRNLSDTPSIMALLAHMFPEVNSGGLPISKEDALKAFQDILVQMIPLLNLEPKPSEEPPAPRVWTIYSPEPTKPHAGISERLSGQTLAELFHVIFQLQTEAGLDQILEKIKAQAEKADAEMFHSTLLPFLQNLPPVAERNGVSLGGPEGKYRTLYQTVLNAYLKRYVRSEPVRPQTWERDPAKCECKHCKLYLNHFLRDPYERWGSFSFNEKQRKHFEQIIYYQSLPNDYTSKTIRTRTPYTLLIGKTENSWRREWDAWAKRSRTAGEKLKQLDSSMDLKNILGDQYNKLVSMEDVRAPDGVNNKAAPCHVNTNIIPRILYSEKSAEKLRAHVAYEPPSPGSEQGVETAAVRGGGSSQQPLRAGTGNAGGSRGTKRATSRAGGSAKRRKT